MFGKWFGKKKEESTEQKPPAPLQDPTGPPAQPTSPAQPVPPAVARVLPAEARVEPVSPQVPPVSPEEEAKPSRWSLFARALEKTRKGLKSLFTFRRALDEEFLGEIEAELFAADFGPEMVDRLLHGPDGVRAAWKDKRISQAEEVREFLKTELKKILERRQAAIHVAPAPPTVILVAGVNGTGKTTSVAKLSKWFKDQGKTVILAAADTFRAAAVEQLTIWSQRLGVEIVTGSHGADPASVAYRGAEAALEHKADVLIVDTAGRLHTQKNLMRELSKIRTVLAKKVPGSPHECLLVLDATTGQNAINQAKTFQEEIQVTGIILAKLDGTAKGGIVVTINNILDIPVKFIGVGERLQDLESFSVEKFVDALFEV
jgi:fused signal recognition particle receptor